ncbi:substrate-binding domain-containing protein [Edaphobacter modestus]|uniref:Autoinducer 2 import system permease protein LsrD n=1 Tax=Edaphobacter modestus TaxID=388466 RepID=A0A4Q7YTH8_9BACT|nr:substrate-binding domain-containing protein [Edaphobacter modestus]RZU41067.1 monosaccharide ABC transporter substrate-binding protein (CUT2 family) /monosaccharide ABC transporter membrane protein (CUT2 family) [Edaphobacter modestus]
MNTLFRPKLKLSGMQWILVGALLIEGVIFSLGSPAFLTWGNLLEILRFSVELGLLAIALTPILITGGIDLSVGSTIGLVAVTFGLAWHTLHLPILLAIALALLIGCLCGAINAVLIAGLHLPALIITLGTYSLYRGIAEGITRASESFTGYPHDFLLLGQGYLWKIPVQVFLFAFFILVYGILLHRSVIGRGLYAIGLNSEGAHYAGIPVRRYLSLVYLLSGAIAGLAAIIYVAHLGLAKSDLGTGFELQAITAIVIGGTSVFGGRGNLFGTVLGLLFLCVLQNGLHLLAAPSEATGVLTGVLLISVVAIDLLHENIRTFSEHALRHRKTILLAASACTLFAVVLVIHHLRSSRTSVSGQHHRPVIAVMPKAKGDPYFLSARAGAEEAAQKLGVDLIWDGPTSLDASLQNELVESWITRGVDAVVVAVENKGSISTVLRKARQHHIAVLTWDADAEPDARDYFLNQATPEAIANTLTDEGARLLSGKGQFAIITGALSAENQNQWIAFIKSRVAEKYPQLKLMTVLPSDDDRDKAFTQTQNILKVYREVKLVIAISAPAVPGAAEAVQQSGRDVDVIGLSLPTICRPYIHKGVVQTIVLWNTRDLGYLTVYAGWLASQKKIAADATSIQAGRLGPLDVHGSEIILGKPMIIDKTNIDRLNF